MIDVHTVLYAIWDTATGTRIHFQYILMLKRLCNYRNGVKIHDSGDQCTIEICLNEYTKQKCSFSFCCCWHLWLLERTWM